MMCAVRLDSGEKLLMTPTGQFICSTGGRSQTGHCVRRACVGKCQEDTNDQAGGQACPNLQGQSTALLHSTACLQDSIDKKPDLGLEVYFNKANEGTDMLESGHTIASLRKHFGHSSHYEVQLTLEHGLTSDCPRTPLTSITWRSYTTPLKTQHIRHKGPHVKKKKKKRVASHFSFS